MYRNKAYHLTRRAVLAGHQGPGQRSTWRDDHSSRGHLIGIRPFPTEKSVTSLECARTKCTGGMLGLALSLCRAIGASLLGDRSEQDVPHPLLAIGTSRSNSETAIKLSSDCDHSNVIDLNKTV
jgi:hypothetical protein